MIEAKEKPIEIVVKEELEEKRQNIKTFEELTEYINYISENCNTGYGTAPRAIAQASLAVAWYLTREFGLTGFQASFVMWDFIRGFMYTDNTCGMKIVDYDDMLYPQYRDKYEKTISAGTWEALQEQAKKKLADRDLADVHPAVVQHWRSIADGTVPFGYLVKED